VLAAFFLPYILPVSVVFRIWGGCSTRTSACKTPSPVNNGSISRSSHDRSSCAVALSPSGVSAFNVLLFIAACANFDEIYEASLDGASAGQFRRITGL